MNVPPLLQRHPSLRWLAPLAVLGVAGLAATGVFRAQATADDLPGTTPKALIAAVQAPEATGFSGTVVSRLSLGLPDLPMLDTGGSGSSALSLLSGSHTLQVWYGGPEQQRIALLGATDETDLFRSGRQVWQWTSADRTAVHAVLPDRPQERTRPAVPLPSSPASMTPTGLARDLLRNLDPTTAVTVKDNRRVANRSAYELVLRPRTAATRVGAVHIMVDGRTKVPLGVEVYPRGSGTPAVDVAFTSIRFQRPPSTYFSFTPPSGATVREAEPGSLRGALPRLRTTAPAGGPSGRPRVTSSGSGWTTVLRVDSGATGATRALARSGFRDAFTRVSGTWGKGRLLTSDLLSVLVTDSGRVLIGAVDPQSLFAAAR
ncbi:LolA family protein [Jatrophihabitans fulvus]